jgi:biotin transport system substrate-specific component
MTTPTAALLPRAALADLVPGGRVRDVALTLAGAGVTGLLAQVSIHLPFTPVPVTLQTFAVLLVGASLGSARGAAAMALYAVAGALGAPWFAAGSSGWGGASFGYILGFVVAAALVGALTDRGRADRRVLTTAAQFALGTVVVYAVGATWLAVALHVDAAHAFELGVRPFLAVDALKIILAAAGLPALWSAIARMRGTR